MSEELQQSVEAPAEEISASVSAADAAPGAGAPPADEPADRPAGVPEKFWDREAGAIRMEALLKSYVELERKLGSMVPLPGDDDQEGRERLRRALGVPASPEHYQIEIRDELVEPTLEINARLHEAGFSQEQAQLVYDLAAEHLLPVIDDAAAELRATRDAERLAAHFGGDAAWQNMARQVKAWGEANLAGDVYRTLASSYDGVLAMHQMMQAREPSVLRDAEGPQSDLDETSLTRMMRDPRYWRERDPALVAQVTEGFKRLYPS
ncbi:MAG: capsid assembly protein [Geminicoccaceae bacterium]